MCVCGGGGIFLCHVPAKWLAMGVTDLMSAFHLIANPLPFSTLSYFMIEFSFIMFHQSTHPGADSETHLISSNVSEILYYPG